MPVTAQAKRALRKDRHRTVFNLRIRRQVKKVTDEARLHPTTKNLNTASSALDRAAKKHIIHHKKASRLKSQLAKLTNQRSQAKSSKAATKAKSPPKTTKKTSTKSS